MTENSTGDKYGSAESALNEDLAFARRLGIHSLPAYLIQYKEKALLMQSFEYQDFSDAIKRDAIRITMTI